METQAETEDTLQDYADKHIESVTALDEAETDRLASSDPSAPSDSHTQDSVEELLHEADGQTPAPSQPDPDVEDSEEITLLEKPQDTEDPSDEITLVEAPDTAEPATIQTDDALSTQTTVDSVVEAVLFACDEPVTVAKLAGIVECTSKQVKTSVDALNEQYKQHNRAFRIEQIAGGLQMLTLPYYDHWLRKMIKVRADNKLTPASLETLAIVAYKQPAIRADVEAIRGVASGEMLRGLMVKGLVKMVGRAEVVGRPMQYGTTKKFLECFGLNTLKDLPQIEELKRPSEEETPEP
ncbi:MAG: SMC-Scp complex subunit ScpB [Phycisphaeraceae bacterium]|nr:SMC-Scp complex subunit ScpB [Phycisphaeraceae bacterium]